MGEPARAGSPFFDRMGQALAVVCGSREVHLGLLNHREPGTPPPALSKEEKKRNRPSRLYYQIPFQGA